MNEPLTPPDCDLRDFPYMPLDVVRLRDSESAVISSGDEFRAAVLLWCAAWHQVPAASLPNDDRLLANLAGYGRDMKGWKRVRENALRGFVECSDGRIYHAVIAEKAREAWEKKWDRPDKAAERSEHARKAARARWENAKSNAPSMPEHMLDPVPENALNREERNRKEKDAAPNGAHSDVKAPDAELFDRGKKILGKNAGGLIADLLKAKGKNVALARAALEMASTKENPREYIGAIVRGADPPGDQYGVDRW